MKVFTIEIANVVEKTFINFLKEWDGVAKVRFTRFIDLGGKQTDLYLYPNTANAAPWLILRVKSVFKSDEGECMQYFVEVPSEGKTLEDVVVSPENWKIPALADKILELVRNDLLLMINQISESSLLDSGSSGANMSSGSSSDDEDLDDIDTSGILAGGDAAEPMDFDPEAIINAAAEGDEGKSSDDENNSDFNPEDIFKD
ncbi:hypothetical protein MLD52_20595 [Puniceicoccaceae bacterium K14]|nr:hypothetical protein [Puniceicoccaceae bacterium K14]